jgi:hypothetical protein
LPLGEQAGADDDSEEPVEDINREELERALFIEGLHEEQWENKSQPADEADEGTPGKIACIRPLDNVMRPPKNDRIMATMLGFSFGFWPTRAFHCLPKRREYHKAPRIHWIRAATRIAT